MGGFGSAKRMGVSVSFSSPSIMRISFSNSSVVMTFRNPWMSWRLFIQVVTSSLVPAGVDLGANLDLVKSGHSPFRLTVMTKSLPVLRSVTSSGLRGSANIASQMRSNSCLLMLMILGPTLVRVSPVLRSVSLRMMQLA